MHALAAWLFVAEPAPVELRWDAPEVCPGEAEVRRGVETLLAAPLSEPRPRPMTVIASVQVRAPGFSLRIFTVTAAGTRERALRHDLDCAALTRAATVLMAIAIDPEVLGRLDPASLSLVASPPAPPLTPPAADPASPPPIEPVGPPPAPTPTPTPPPVEPPAHPPAATRPPTSPPDVPPPRPRPRGGVRLTGGLGWGDLPAVGGGLGLAGGAIWRRVRVEALASVWPARRARIAGTDAGGDFLLWTIGARACPQVRPHPRIELPLCAGFEAGELYARGVALVDERAARTTWFALVLAPSLAIAVTPAVALWVAPELAVPATRTTFRVEGGEIHRAGAVAVRGVLGVEVRFPRGRAMDRRPDRNEGRGRP